jgi:FtsP/CotA-like multicopper oxidase with cupredoxin domain
MVVKTSVRMAVIVGALVAGAGLLPMLGASREYARDLRLVIVDKTFYVEGQPTPNPTLKLRAGERIRLVLHNEDEGMRHDLRIGEWNVAVPAIDGKGERAITFRVPEGRRSVSYACTPHSASMRGAIEVESPRAPLAGLGRHPPNQN